MSNVEEKLAKPLTAESTEMIPYLPYLLQDLMMLMEKMILMGAISQEKSGLCVSGIQV